MNENQKDKEKRDNEFPQDFRMRYQELTTAIENTKKREWSLTYYLLLLYAAIIGFCEVMTNRQTSISDEQKAILLLMALLITVFGMWLLYSLTKTLVRYRCHLILIYEHLSTRFQGHEDKWQKEIYDVKETDEWKKRETSFQRALLELPIYLTIMLIMGFCLVCWYLFGMANVKVIPLLFKCINSSGYIFIVIGSLGMIGFASRFPFSTRIKDLQLSSARLLGLNGYQVWVWSWISILFGSAIQILMIWII